MQKTKYIYNNTVVGKPTHFMAATELIQRAREDFNVASENWPSAYLHFGDPENDLYYAEIWTDGMDWQHTYWLLEYIHWEVSINPLMRFDDHDVEDKIAPYSFRELSKALLWERRRLTWTKDKNTGVYGDTVWPFFDLTDEMREQEIGDPYWRLVRYSHASQVPVEFWVNNSLFQFKK